MAILDALKKNKDEKGKLASPEKSQRSLGASTKSSGEAKKETVKNEDLVISAKKKTKKVDLVEDNSVKVGQKITTLQNILKHPRITEKAAILAERNVYTFEVDPHAGKIEIARAVKQIYNVEPVRVNIIKLPAKKVTIRGKRGVKSAVKKALVYLKEGDKIEFV